MRSPLADIVERFQREPSRTGSLIITFYGDAVLPRGGSVWLGTLLAFLELLGIGGNVVRTAMSRLAADGWLQSEKLGRNSFYRLGAGGRARFESAVAHVYQPHSVEWQGGLELILIASAADREASRAALQDAGFGSPMPGVWVAPSGTEVPLGIGDAIRLEVSASDVTGRRLVRESWPLGEIAAAYGDFIDEYRPLRRFLSSRTVKPTDAIVARTLLIHRYRRVLLRDPLLPAALLPPQWPAHTARALCGEIYRALLPASEAWLDEFGRSARGALPAARGALAARFAPEP